MRGVRVKLIKFLIIFGIFYSQLIYPNYNLKPNENAPLTFYKPTYFLFWNEPVKFQLSIKYRLGLSENRKIPSGIYLGYTQKSLWDLYNKKDSAPFIETNYSPEGFFLYEFDDNFFLLKNFMFGYQHESNGLGNKGYDAGKSKSWERVYAALIFELIENRSSLGVRAWSALKTHSMRGVRDYIGRYEIFLRMILLNSWLRPTLELKVLPIKHFPEFGNIETGLTLGSETLPMLLYFQYWYGYGEMLGYYNNKTAVFRTGVRLDF